MATVGTARKFSCCCGCCRNVSLSVHDDWLLLFFLFHYHAPLVAQGGRPQEAEMFFWRSLAIEEEQMGADHPHVAVTLADLGARALASGRTEQAEGLLTRSLAITEKSGEATLGYAGTLHCLAECARKSGRWQEVEGLLKRALAIEEEKGYRGIAGTLGQLATWAYDAGRPGEAEGLFRRALFLEEQTLGENHRDVATTLNRLGKCLSQLNKTEEAAGLHRRALEIVEEEAGDRSIEVKRLVLQLDTVIGCPPPHPLPAKKNLQMKLIKMQGLSIRFGQLTAVFCRDQTFLLGSAVK